jgi:hypothetical protein
VEDYSCIGADGEGVLPEIVLYMNEDIKTVDTTKFIKLYDCGTSCWGTDLLTYGATLKRIGTGVGPQSES